MGVSPLRSRGGRVTRWSLLPIEKGTVPHAHAFRSGGGGRPADWLHRGTPHAAVWGPAGRALDTMSLLGGARVSTRSALSDVWPVLHARFGVRVIAADSHPMRGCQANAADLAAALSQGVGHDETGRLRGRGVQPAAARPPDAGPGPTRPRGLRPGLIGGERARFDRRIDEYDAPGAVRDLTRAQRAQWLGCASRCDRCHRDRWRRCTLTTGTSLTRTVILEGAQLIGRVRCSSPFRGPPRWQP